MGNSEVNNLQIGVLNTVNIITKEQLCIDMQTCLQCPNAAGNIKQQPLMFSNFTVYCL